MNFNFIVPQSPAGAVPALYCVPPNLAKSQTTPFSFLHPKFKTEMCNKYDPMLGCPYGEQCQFRHPEDPHPSQSVIKRMSQVTINDNVALSNNNISTTINNATFGVPAAAGRSGGRYVARANIPPIPPNGEFRRRNTSFVSQYSGRQYLRTKGGNNGNRVNLTNSLESRPPINMLSYLHPKFKTEMCNKYDSTFGCPYGEQCQFRHPEDPYPTQLVMKKISQINSDGCGNANNNINLSNHSAFSAPMAAGRGGGAGRFGGRTNGIGSEFRRRNTSFTTQQHNNSGRQGKYYNNNKFFGSVDSGGLKTKKIHNPDFLSNSTLPHFMKFANKVPKNGMRRYNSQETIGHFTYSRVALLKKQLTPSCYPVFPKL